MVDRPRKAWRSSNAATFVLSSRDGGFSTAILQALSRGIPTVIDSECHFPEAAAAGAAVNAALDPQPIDNTVLLVANQDRRSRMHLVKPKLVRRPYIYDWIAVTLLNLNANFRRYEERSSGSSGQTLWSS